MADSFVTRQPILHVVPDNLPDEVAALTEPYCVAFNAMVERARVRPGDTVSVIGPGTVGIFSAEIALLSGAAEVVVIGAPGDEPRLQLAEETGATATLIADNPKWWEEAELSSTSDVVIDASGVSATLEAALELVRAGGQVVKVGWGPETYGRPLDLIVAKAVNLHGAFSHTWSTWERVLKLLGTGRLDPRKALRTYSLQDWEMAFGAMADRTILKAVLVP
jgi:L-iditol 2-dehydrogenase